MNVFQILTEDVQEDTVFIVVKRIKNSSWSKYSTLIGWRLDLPVKSLMGVLEQRVRV